MPVSIAASNISTAQRKSIIKNTHTKSYAKRHLVKDGLNGLKRLADLLNQLKGSKFSFYFYSYARACGIFFIVIQINKFNWGN